MSFLSIEFAVFTAVLLAAYYTVFKKNQWLLLLCGSLIFYVYASPYYLIFLAFSIVTGYLAAIRLGRLDEDYDKTAGAGISREDKKKIKEETQKKKKKVLIYCLIVNIAILAVLKYTGFFMENLAAIIGIFGCKFTVPQVNFILPLGISYYTFMTISYLCDVYWGVHKAQESFFKYALFIVYFPHITQGPIDSYADINEGLYNFHEYDFTNIKEGLYRIILGLFKKLVIAGRLAVYVDEVYGNVNGYSGLTLLCATFFYAIQMYCDFSGYMDMAVGVSRLFGVRIAENFNLPYFSKSIPEYWRRWHITLGVWFRSYIYYPVIRSGLCKKISKALKKNHSKETASMVTTIVGLAAVWLLTGLWHGASWHYVMHGVYHGTIIILSTILAGTFKKMKKTLKISDDSRLFGAFQIVRTFILVDISYILFRSSSLKDAGCVIRKIFTEIKINTSAVSEALMPFTGDNTAVSYALVTFAAIALLFIAECCKFNGKKFFEEHRYMTSAVMVVITLLFGIFGQSTFLYAAY